MLHNLINPSLVKDVSLYSSLHFCQAVERGGVSGGPTDNVAKRDGVKNADKWPEQGHLRGQKRCS